MHSATIQNPGEGMRDKINAQIERMALAGSPRLIAVSSLSEMPDLFVYSRAVLEKVVRQLNQRPRNSLDYETPAYKLQANVAAIS